MINHSVKLDIFLGGWEGNYYCILFLRKDGSLLLTKCLCLRQAFNFLQNPFSFLLFKECFLSLSPLCFVKQSFCGILFMLNSFLLVFSNPVLSVWNISPSICISMGFHLSFDQPQCPVLSVGEISWHLKGGLEACTTATWEHEPDLP